MRLTRSMTLLRLTSLGWAVITGITSAWSSRVRTAAASTPSPASRPIAPASERSAPSPALSRRRAPWSSAMLISCEKHTKLWAKRSASGSESPCSNASSRAARSGVPSRW